MPAARDPVCSPEGEPYIAETNVFSAYFGADAVYVRVMARRLSAGTYQLEDLCTDTLMEMHGVDSGEPRPNLYSFREAFQILWLYERQKYDDIRTQRNKTRMAAGTRRHFMDYLSITGLDLKKLAHVQDANIRALDRVSG